MDEYVYSDREKLGKMTEERDELQVRIKELEAIVEIARMEQGRVKELETRAAKEAQETIEMEAELNQRIATLKADLDYAYGMCRPLENAKEALKTKVAELERDNANMSADIETYRSALAGAALVAASGQGEVEEVLVIYGSANNFNNTQGAYLADGYRRVGWKVLADERVAVMWQRPARPESEGEPNGVV